MRRSSEMSDDARRPFKRVESSLAGGVSLLTTARSSARMSGVRQCDTAPERVVRRAARAAGLTLRRRNPDLPGSPDLANRARKIAIFVHGCYWHRHAGCSKATTPKSNRSFWVAKFSRNVERDRTAVEALQQLGFRVIVVWECETRDEDAIVRRLELEAFS
jgi:DNA mismatch endonuclease (patch repair protein)